jgi:proteasome alpha subunit
MLEEPYRWVEAIRNRRDYLEDQLRGASPVVATRYQQGVLLLTTTPGPRKVFEVYNEIAFAAIGHPADIEKLRKAVIDIAHLEGFNLSARDVNLQRLVSFGIGPLVKGAFDEIFRSPFLARVLLAELDPPSGDDMFYTIDADGSFVRAGHVAAVGSEESVEAIGNALRDHDPDSTLDAALNAALWAWACGRMANDREDGEQAPESEQIEAFLRSALSDLKVEAAVLDRSTSTKSKFRLLQDEEMQPLLNAYREA